MRNLSCDGTLPTKDSGAFLKPSPSQYYCGRVHDFNDAVTKSLCRWTHTRQNLPSKFLFRFPNRNLRAQGGCLGCSKRWRTWTICDMLRGADNQALIRRSPNGETSLVIARDFGHRSQRAHGGNWNILVPLGTENNSYFLSSGERNGNSPNQSNYF